MRIGSDAIGWMAVGMVGGFVATVWLLDHGHANIVVLLLGGIIAAEIWLVHLYRQRKRQR